MKAVLLSACSNWCEKIVSGEATVRVCKSMLSIPTPFKCYIYCTKGKPFIQKIRFGDIAISNTQISNNLYNGKIIGEFVCDKVEKFEEHIEEGGLYYTLRNDFKLKIYDKPKELSEFYHPCSYDGLCSSCKRFKANGSSYDICNSEITRPPQSWCYVQELEE